MSIEIDEDIETIKSVLCDVNAIKYCDCGSYYWTVNEDSNVYAFVFSKLKKENIKIDSKLVKKTVAEILKKGGMLDWECPHCGSKVKY